MKKLFVLLIFGLVVFVTPGTSHAQIQFLNNWTIDIDGAGVVCNPVTINEFLDIIGPAYVVNSFTTVPPSVGDSGTFDIYALFISSRHDFGTQFPWSSSNEFTGNFQGSGTVELGGPLVFAAGGTLEIYADLGKVVPFATDTADFDPSIYGANEGTLIATFVVESGDGEVDSSGIPNGEITVIFRAISLAPGFWFDSNGNDLSKTPHLVRGFSTTNASYVGNPTPATITDLAGEFAGVSSQPNNPPGDMFLGANGQFRLFVEEEEEEPGQCRMTGGSVTDNWEYIEGTYAEVKKNLTKGVEKYTTGGQVGAPNANDPSYGEWTHTHHSGSEGSFTFRAGTHSAPDGTEISSIACGDEGWCVQARCAPFKQIYFDGIGSFKNVKGSISCVPENEESLHYFRAHVADYGEPGKNGKQQSEAECDWVSGGLNIADIVFIDAVPDDKFGDKGGQECDGCPDWYEIEIHCSTDPDSDVIYSVADFIDGGNFQIHPEVGQQCPY